MVRFHGVYEKLSQAFDDFPYGELEVSDEFKEQVCYALLSVVI